jgi:hypothetical protein
LDQQEGMSMEGEAVGWAMDESGNLSMVAQYATQVPCSLPSADVHTIRRAYSWVLALITSDKMTGPHR